MKSMFRFKILLIMIVSILIPVIFLTIFITTNSDAYYENYVLPSEKAHFENDIKKIEQFFLETEDLLKLYANMLSVTVEYRDYINVLDHFVHNNDEFQYAFYTSKYGDDYISEDKKTDVDGRDRLWYQKAEERQGFYISPPYEDVITKKMVITLSIPVYLEGEFMGVFGVDCSMNDIMEVIINASPLENAHYIITKNSFDKASGPIILWPEGEEEIKLASELLKKNIQTDSQIPHSIPLEEFDSFLNIRLEGDSYVSEINDIRVEMTLLFVIVIVISIIFAISTARRLSDPLGKFAECISNRNEVSPFKDPIRYWSEWDDEFKLLFKMFDKLSSQIQIEEVKLSKRIKTLQEKNEALMDKNIDLEAIYKNLKLIDKKVRKSRKEYESILENIKGMIWVLDGQGNIVFVNSTLNESLGYDEEYLNGKPYSKIIQNTYEERFSLLNLLSKRDYKKIDINLMKYDGKVINVESNTSRVMDDYGNLLYIYGICRSTNEVKELHYNYNVKLEEQNLIMDLTETASMNVSMNQVTKAIFEKINSIFGWSVGTIRFLNDNNEFELIARTEVGMDYIVNQSLNYDQSCLTYVIENNEIMYINKVEDLPIQEEIYCQIIEDGYSIIFIPVGNNDIGRGVISLTIDRVSMTEKEEMLKSFTNTILIVVERALIYEKLKKDYIRMIKVLAEAGDDKDSSSVGHSNRVAEYSKIIGEYLYLDDDEIVELEICGLLHDIGKIGISDQYLSSGSEKAIEEVKAHPTIGRKMLEDIGLAEEILDGIEMHHMNYDLSGYPKLPEVEVLPMFPRIIQVADEFDNMRNSHKYENDRRIYEAMQKSIGVKYCPQVMRVFKEIIENNLIG